MLGRGETEEDYEWCLDQTINKDGKPWDANMILDDGGDLTVKVHKEYPEMLEHIHGYYFRRDNYRRKEAQRNA